MANKAFRAISTSLKNLISFPQPTSTNSILTDSWGLMPRSQRNYKSNAGNGLENSIVVAAVFWIMRNFPEAPMVIGKDDENNKTGQGHSGFNFTNNHPLIKLINKPNKFYSGNLLWAATLTDLTLAGNAYWIKVRNKKGDVVELWYVYQAIMEPIGSPTEYISHYMYYPSGSGRAGIRYETDDVVHFRFGMDPKNIIKGLSPLASLLREIYTDDEASNFSASIVTNLGVPGVIITPSTLGGNGYSIETDADTIKKDFINKTIGDKRGEPIIFTSPTDVKQIAWSPQQMDLTAIRRIPEERVSAVLGIPAMVLGLGAGLEHSCLPGDIRVWTTKGPVPIKDIVKGDYALSLSSDGIVEYQHVNAQWKTGTLKTFEIRTKNKTIRSTGNHPFLVRKAGSGRVGANNTRQASLEWKYAEDLSIGDWVVQLKEAPDLNNTLLPDGTEATVDFMKFAGMLLGDGHVREDLGYIQIALPKEDRVRSQYEVIIRKVLAQYQIFEPKFTDSRSGFSFSSRILVNKCVEFNLNGYAITKRIPEWIFSLSKELRLAYIAGLIDSDGTIDKRGVATFCQANEELVKDLKDLLLSCGIPSSNISHKVIKASQLPQPGLKEEYEAWAFACSPAGLLAEIPFEDTVYRDRVNNNLSRNKKSGKDSLKLGLPSELGFYKIKSITENELEEVYDIEVNKNHNFIANGIVVKNSFTNHQSAKEAAYENNIIPMQRLLSEEIHLQLLRDFEDEKTLEHFKITFDLSNVRALATDMTELYARANIGINGGWMKLSEGRQLVNLPVDETHDMYLRSWRVVAVPPEKSTQLPLQAIPNTSRGIGGSSADLVPLPAEPRDVFGSSNPDTTPGLIPVPPAPETPVATPVQQSLIAGQIKYVEAIYPTVYQEIKRYSLGIAKKVTTDGLKEQEKNQLNRLLLKRSNLIREDLTTLLYSMGIKEELTEKTTNITIKNAIFAISCDIFDDLNKNLSYNKDMKVNLFNLIDIKKLVSLLYNITAHQVYAKAGIEKVLDISNMSTISIEEMLTNIESIYLPVI